MNHILEADSILLEFKERKVLSNIYIKVETGKITGLLGRNGQGKTCLLNIIYGSLSATDKSIRIDKKSENDVYKKPEKLLYLPQFNFIPGSLKIKKIFEHFEVDFSSFENKFSEFSAKQNVAMKRLSGGQRRLIEVYIIIKATSQFAMLDEPFSHLMPLQIEKIKEILIEEKKNKGFIITDHLYNQIIDISDCIYVLSDGKTHLIKQLSDIEKLGYVRF